MALEDPRRIRNVALVGHRGSGKTSLAEALLYEAGAIDRLGSVAEGTTTCDSQPDERARHMSISAALAQFRWRGHKINLIDTPGEPSFVADAIAALRVCETAVFVVNGAMGVEVGTERLWQRAEEIGLARLVFVNMLDRERADFDAVLEQLKERFGPHVVATEVPIGSEQEFRGVVDLVDMKAFVTPRPERGQTVEAEIPDELAERAEKYRERLMDEVAELSDELMERYLEGEAISHEEIVAALERGVSEGRIFPVACGSATRNIGTLRLLDALVEDLPSPAEIAVPALAAGDPLTGAADAPAVALVFKTLADPYAGTLNLLRVYEGTVRSESQLLNGRTGQRERVGQLLSLLGKSSEPVEAVGPGDFGAVAKLKDTHVGDVLTARREAPALAMPELPRPVMAFAVEPHSRADEDKVTGALARLCEEDPTLDVHRDPQTGELIVAGLTPMHVEVVVGRLKERFGVEVDLKPPRVPYRETITRQARAHARHKKQTGGRGQFADCHIVIEPLGADGGFEFVDEIRGGVIPGQFIPAVEKGVREAMSAGVVAGYPVQGVRVRVVDGKHHPVDSSEIAFKIAGSMAFKQAMAEAGPVLLEPIMRVTVTVPDECVGDVIGDLNARRGRPLGMEPRGGVTEVRAEVPMAEMLSYGADLRSLTGGRGDYAMELARYEQVPAQIAKRIAAEEAGEPVTAKA